MRKCGYSDCAEKLVTISQAKDRYKMSRSTLMKYGKQFDALLKIGNMIRVDIEKFDAGLESEMKYPV